MNAPTTAPALDTARLWDAIWRLTEPQRVSIERDWTDVTTGVSEQLQREADQLDQTVARLHHRLEHATDRERPTLRRATSLAMARRARALRASRASATPNATVGSPWSQAVDALTENDRHVGEGGGGDQSERSLYDHGLADTVQTIRDVAARAVNDLQLVPAADVPHQLRQLARGLVDLEDAEGIAIWTRVIDTWARTLTTHLRAAGRQPKPVRLRGVQCPACLGLRIQVPTGEPPPEDVAWAAPLVVTFVGDTVKGGHCEICRTTWPRGDALWDLVDHSRVVPEQPTTTKPPAPPHTDPDQTRERARYRR